MINSAINFSCLGLGWSWLMWQEKYHTIVGQLKENYCYKVYPTLIILQSVQHLILKGRFSSGCKICQYQLWCKIDTLIKPRGWHQIGWQQAGFWLQHGQHIFMSESMCSFRQSKSMKNCNLLIAKPLSRNARLSN